MRRVSVGTARAPEIFTRVYRDFRGADFSTDPTQVDAARSPDCLNLLPDLAGFPEKRPGWRVLAEVEAPVNGIFYWVDTSGQGRFIVHGGTKLYSWDGQSGTPALIFSGMANARSSGFVHGGKLYLLDGSCYRLCEAGESGITVSAAAEKAFVPTTVIGAAPNGGGTAFEAVNLLTPRRKNSFVGDGSSKTFALDSQGLDAAAVTAVVEGTELAEGSGFLVDRAAGAVTFETAPPVYAGGGGVDNVVIAFSKTVEGNRARIDGCTVAAHYGFNSENRLFFSGNRQHKNQDWHSGLDDPTYFPDTGYTKIGADSSAIVGYLRQQDSLLILKEDNDQDAEIFLRTAEMLQDGTVIFPVRQGVKGVGALTCRAMATLRDDPLFLAREGVFAVVSGSVNEQRAVQCRSAFVNARLCAAANLPDACAAVWNGFYVLCAGGCCFVADSRQRAAMDGGWGYEWYYWDNIPARVLFEQDGALFFGTADGRLCRFNTDIFTMERYNDDGAPIRARWVTRAEDFGSFAVRKTLLHRGCAVMIKPYTRSSIDISVLTEKEYARLVRSASMDIFTFSDLDFDRIDFNTKDSPQVKSIRTRVKRFALVQLALENAVKNEGFGIYGVQLQYQRHRYVKE